MIRALAVAAAIVAPSCAAQPLESLTEQQFQTLRADCALVAQAAAFRLVQEGVLTPASLQAVAGAIDAIANGDVTVAVNGLLTDAMVEAGFTAPEVLLAMRGVEAFLVSTGAIQFADGGTIVMSPRTRDILHAMATAMAHAILAPPAEIEQGEGLIEEAVEETEAEQ